MKSLEVNLEFLPSDQSGRLSPIKTGYIGNLLLGGLYTGVRIDLHDRLELSPGQCCLARFRFPNWSYIAHLVSVGTTFELVEGSRSVGKGKVLKIE
jgi:hypothetical protein